MSHQDGIGAAAKTEKSLAVLETEEHAEQVVARSAGKDMVETLPHGHGSARPTLPGQQPGRDWESLRPIEVTSTPPPVIPYPDAWHRKQGRVCALDGIGKMPLRLLRARRSY